MFTLAFIGMYAEREGGVLKEGDNLLAMFGRVLGEVNVNNYPLIFRDPTSSQVAMDMRLSQYSYASAKVRCSFLVTCYVYNFLHKSFSCWMTQLNSFLHNFINLHRLFLVEIDLNSWLLSIILCWVQSTSEWTVSLASIWRHHDQHHVFHWSFHTRISTSSRRLAKCLG